MSDKYILSNGVITDGFSFLLENGAIEIENGAIQNIFSSNELPENPPEVIDLGGRLVLPGLLNPHHHLYSALATGLSPRGETNNFTQILENLWWHLDKNLDAETIYYSAFYGLMKSVAYGVTTVFDHHASMNYISGSLNQVEKAVRESGIKGLLCLEMSDRNGDESLPKQLDENLQFWEEHRRDQSVRGVLGLHANFTLSNESLDYIQNSKPQEMPVHIHCGEDQVDLQYCIDQGFAGPVDRLQKYELLTNNTLLAHCIHLSSRDYTLLKEYDPIVISNPESNANNQVGSMDLSQIDRYCLGTDGMTGNILGTVRSHFLQQPAVVGNLPNILFKYLAEIVDRFFSESGTPAVNQSADLAVTDYVPVTEINLENLIYHLLFGVEGQKMYMTIARGKILYRDGQFTQFNASDKLKDITKAAQRLHRKFYE